MHHKLGNQKMESMKMKRDKACCYQKKSWLRMPSFESASVASLVTLMEGFWFASESIRFWKWERAEEVIVVVGNGLYCLRENLLSWSCNCLVLLAPSGAFFLPLDFGVFLVIFKSLNLRFKTSEEDEE